MATTGVDVIGSFAFRLSAHVLEDVERMKFGRRFAFGLQEQGSVVELAGIMPHIRRDTGVKRGRRRMQRRARFQSAISTGHAN
jgi:hypothetical protein